MLTTFDLSLIAVIAFFAFTSLRKGFLHEFTSWIGWAIAVVIAYFTYPFLIDPFYDYLLTEIVADDYVSKDSASSKVFTFLIIMMIVGISITFILRSFFQQLFSNKATNIFSRIFGCIVLGLIKTFVLAFLFSSFYNHAVPIFNLDTHPPFLTESFSYFYILQAIEFFTELFPSQDTQLLEKF